MIKNFFSITYLIRSLNNVVDRFPLSILFAGAICVLMSGTIENHFEEEQGQKWMMSLYIGFLLSIIVYLGLPRYAKPKLKIWLGAIVVLLSLTYFFFLPQTDLGITDGVRFLFYAIVLHLIVAFIPFNLMPATWHDDVNEFWEYNKTLFLRFLSGGLYTAVLWGGLSLAVLAIDQLFNIDIDYKVYGHLFIWMAGLFNTVFFLGGLPSNQIILKSEIAYPKGLKIFTQYVLLPLVVIFILIIHVYIIKILFTNNWPKGWVTYLVLSLSISGMLSLLLVWPVRNEEHGNWFASFSKYFYSALVLPIIVLFIAIFKRINDYGFTENRFTVLVLGIWLAGIVLYFLFSKYKNIKLIPLSLAIAGVVSFDSSKIVSKTSQQQQVLKIASQADMLMEEKLVPIDSVKLEQYILDFRNDSTNVDRMNPIVEFNDKLSYLVEWHGRSTLLKLLNPSIVTKLNGNIQRQLADCENCKVYDYQFVEMVRNELGTAKAMQNYQTDYKNYYSTNHKSSLVSVTGYDFVASMDAGKSGSAYESNLSFPNDTLTALLSEIDWKAQQLTLTIAEDHIFNFDLNILLAENIKIALNGHGDFEFKQVVEVKEQAKCRVKLIIEGMSMYQTNDEPLTLSSLKFSVCIKWL